ncbi:MAG: hypothetical protein ACKO5J_00140 [Rubrivivax sp.]
MRGKKGAPVRHLPLAVGMAGWVAVASTILGLFALFWPDAPEPPFVRVMSGLAWVSLALALGGTVALVRSTLEEARVLGARVAPRPGWAAQRRSSLLGIAATGGALALAIGWQAAVAVAAAPAAGPATATWLPAMAAAVTLAGALHALLWMGVLAWWGRAQAGWLVGLCVALSGLLAFGWAATQGWIAQAPWLAVPAAAGAAGATWWVHRQLWPPTPPSQGERARSPRVWMSDRAAWLKAGFARVDPVALPFVAILPGQMVPSLAHHPARDSLLFVSWGSEFDLDGVGRLALLAAGMCLCLRTGALHWRWLLAPGGRPRGSLAGDVVLRSWLAAVAMLLLLFGVTLPIAWMVGETPGNRHASVLAWMGEMALRFGPTLLCELLLATALAACVRPLVRSSLAAGLAWLVAALLAFAGAAATKMVPALDSFPGWPREAAHHLGVLACAAVFTWLASFGWRRVDLRQLLAPRPAASTWSSSGLPRLTRQPAASSPRRNS